jgi:hypothetical protein
MRFDRARRTRYFIVSSSPRQRIESIGFYQRRGWDLRGSSQNKSNFTSPVRILSGDALFQENTPATTDELARAFFRRHFSALRAIHPRYICRCA